MKVAHVIEAMHQGGAESLVIEHARRAGPGVETVVVALNRGGPAFEAAAAAGARAVMLGKGRGRFAGLSALARLLREERVDVVNGHNPTGGLYGALAGRAAGVPAVVRTEHSFHYRGRHSALYPALEVATTALSRRVICVCDAVRRSHVERLRWAADRFVTIANGISPAPPVREPAAVRAELGVPEGAPLLLTIGSLTTQKAQHVMLEAFAHARRAAPEAVLAIAGEGPLRESLLAQARALELGDAVRFLGPRGDAADLHAAADVFVLSSVREGLSITLLEAMRAGKPCVATAIGGNGEAVEDGVTGALVPANDPPALGAALAAFALDPARRAAAGAAGRARFERLFTAERMVRATEALYRECLARGGAGAPLAAAAGGGR